MNIVVKDAKEKDNMKVDKKFLNRYKNTKELLITELNKSKAQKRFNNKITINNNIVEIDEKELLKLTLTQLKKISIEIFRNNHKSNTFQNDDNNIMINNEDIKESIKKILGDKRQKEYLIEHLKVFSKLGDVIKYGKLVSESMEQKARQNYNSWHYYVENIIIGKLIPAGTGMKVYNDFNIDYENKDLEDAQIQMNIEEIENKEKEALNE